jgi:virulence-associated protein VagC
VTTSFMNSDLINAVSVQSNGDIVAVGITLNKTTGNSELALARYFGAVAARPLDRCGERSIRRLVWGVRQANLCDRHERHPNTGRGDASTQPRRLNLSRHRGLRTQLGRSRLLQPIGRAFHRASCLGQRINGDFIAARRELLVQINTK